MKSFNDLHTHTHTHIDRPLFLWNVTAEVQGVGGREDRASEDQCPMIQVLENKLPNQEELSVKDLGI